MGIKKLNPKTIKIQAKIITPIHIFNWEIIDRMDYFMLDNDWEFLQVVDRKWLYDCWKNYNELFKNIIYSIENRKFNKLEVNKSKYWDHIWKYIQEEIIVWKKAKRFILQEWNHFNNWEIKRFTRTQISKKLFIPWSTIKWIFRTIFLNDYIDRKNSESNKIEEEDKSDEFKNELSFIEFEDIDVDNLKWNLEIQMISSKQKPKKDWLYSKKWAPQYVELLKSWEFTIDILYLKNHISKNDLEAMLQNYSKKIISREKRIINNVWLKTKIFEDFENLLKKWYFPIKIWMFKKSLAYKLFWEKMIDDLNKIEWKEWLNESRNKWVWDKVIYLDENYYPIWWIAIKIID